jgi:hypothetical protein
LLETVAAGIMNDELALAMAAKEAVFPNLLKRLYEMRKELLEVCDKPYGSALNMTGIKKSMDAVIDQISNCTPYEEVPDIAKL